MCIFGTVYDYKNYDKLWQLQWFVILVMYKSITSDIFNSLYILLLKTFEVDLGNL